MKNGFLSLIAGLLMVAGTYPAVSQEVCKDGSLSVDMMYLSSSDRGYAGAVRHVGQQILAEDGQTGQGTAVAQIEKLVPAYFFRFADGRPPPFGACVPPENRPPDHWGWAPLDDPEYPEYPCKIAWVMCLDADTIETVPVEPTDDNGSRGLRPCDIKFDAINQDGEIVHETLGGHATNAAMGTMAMAPDTKIVAISLPELNAVEARAAYRWLLTPGNVYRPKRASSRTDEHYYVAGKNGGDWASYWRSTFGSQSPIEKFNVVSAAFAALLSPGEKAVGFKQACSMTNPQVPQLDSDGDGIIDIADNCRYVPNVVKTFVGGIDSGLVDYILPDGDEDGLGNRCDADLDNDSDIDWDDFVLFTDIRTQHKNFAPPLDLNDDGKLDHLDRRMFREAIDFDWDGKQTSADYQYFVNELLQRPLGTGNAELLAQLENYLDPDAYIQDLMLTKSASPKELSFIKYRDLSHELADMRDAAVMSVFAVGDNGFSNAISWPACDANALATVGISHLADARVASTYDREQNEYAPDPNWLVRGSVSQRIPILAVHSLGRFWFPVNKPAPFRTMVPHCADDPLKKGSDASSYVASVGAGAVAALRSAGVLPEAPVETIEQLLFQTDKRAFVRRECDAVLNAQYDYPQSVKDTLADLYCDPETTDYAAGVKDIEFSIPLLDLAASYRLGLQQQSLSAATLKDTDNDGISDAVDNCVLIANASQRDSDADGYGDNCDADYNNNGTVDWLDAVYFSDNLDGTNDPTGDFDDSGFVDAADYDFLVTSLSNQPPGPAGQELGDGLADADNDGLYDLVDNCELISNPTQRDSDSDGYGDNCDADYDNNGVVDWLDAVYFTEELLGTGDPAGDFDDSGFVDGVDYDFLLGALNNQPPGPSGQDEDRDGIADHLDNCKRVSNGPWSVYESGDVIARNQLDSDNDQFGDVCDGDLGNDGVVTQNDENRILIKIADNEYYPQADYNFDGVLDQEDLDWFRENLYLPSKPVPGPSGVCLSGKYMSDTACRYYD